MGKIWVTSNRLSNPRMELVSIPHEQSRKNATGYNQVITTWYHYSDTTCFDSWDRTSMATSVADES